MKSGWGPCLVAPLQYHDFSLQLGALQFIEGLAEALELLGKLLL